MRESTHRPASHAAKVPVKPSASRKVKSGTWCIHSQAPQHHQPCPGATTAAQAPASHTMATRTSPNSARAITTTCVCERPRGGVRLPDSPARPPPMRAAPAPCAPPDPPRGSLACAVAPAAATHASCRQLLSLPPTAPAARRSAAAALLLL